MITNPTGGFGMQKVLVIEDDKSLQLLWKGMFRNSLEMVIVGTVREASVAFKQGGFDAIFVDGYLECGGEIIETLDLVPVICASFKGPVIAISANDSMQDKLLAAGCTRACEKAKVPLILKDLFCLPLVL